MKIIICKNTTASAIINMKRQGFEMIWHWYELPLQIQQLLENKNPVFKPGFQNF